MIEKFEDLELDQLDNITEVSQIEEKIEKKLGLSFFEMKDSLSKWTINNSEKLSEEFINIAEFGDYSKFIEDPADIKNFLQTEAHKVDNWKFTEIMVNDKLLTFYFSNNSVDDGDILKGFVYVSFDGKIKHAFAQGE